MHDLHEADKILKIVLGEAVKNKLKHVTKIVIELGSIIEHGQEINPANLNFNIQMLSRGTPAEGAEINVKKVDGNLWKIVSIDGE